VTDPERLPRLSSVVPFLYDVADRSCLPGSVLTHLLVDVGAVEDDAHRALALMRAEGSLGAERRGRETDYELAGLVRLAARRARAASDPDRFEVTEQPVWEGTFSGLLAQVPKTERPARDRLRRAARLAGYARLRQGLMISVRSSWTALAEVISDLPPAATVLPVTLGVRLDDARRVANEAWLLDRAATEIATVTGRLEEAAGQPVNESGAAAFGTYVRLALPAYRILEKIPALPAELTPDAWPLGRMITALATVRQGWGTVAESYAGELLSSDRLNTSGRSGPVGK
jgi:phenylacetic acid degradation operon negative regulatory protein